jgi:hypothetical protein
MENKIVKKSNPFERKDVVYAMLHTAFNIQDAFSMQANNFFYDDMSFFVQQENKEGSLSNISPVWAKRLQHKQPLLFAISLTRLKWLAEIIDADKCVVGEAYGYSSSYTNTCEECTRIANKFSLYFTILWYKKLKVLQQIFVKHWIESQHDSCKYKDIDNISAKPNGGRVGI